MLYIQIWSVYHIQSLGDPKQDLAYERQYEQQTYQVIPEVIKNFIQYFHKTVSDLIDQKVYELQASRVSSDVIDQKVYEIQDIYENRYGPLAEMISYWETGWVMQSVKGMIFTHYFVSYWECPRVFCDSLGAIDITLLDSIPELVIGLK